MMFEAWGSILIMWLAVRIIEVVIEYALERIA